MDKPLITAIVTKSGVEQYKYKTFVVPHKDDLILTENNKYLVLSVTHAVQQMTDKSIPNRLHAVVIEVEDYVD